jgi:hypothetical protein
MMSVVVSMTEVGARCVPDRGARNCVGSLARRRGIARTGLSRAGVSRSALRAFVTLVAK